MIVRLTLIVIILGIFLASFIVANSDQWPGAPHTISGNLSVSCGLNDLEIRYMRPGDGTQDWNVAYESSLESVDLYRHSERFTDLLGVNESENIFFSQPIVASYCNTEFGHISVLSEFVLYDQRGAKSSTILIEVHSSKNGIDLSTRNSDGTK